MRRTVLALLVAMTPVAATAQEPVRLYAAGSLRTALTEIGEAFTRDHNIRVAGTLGASGLLRERIEKGEPAEVFAPADTDHPTTLMRAGKSGPYVVFTRNRLCGLARAHVTVTSATLLDRILDPAVKLGTSTPKADPSGDYAWALFEKAEKVRAGSFARLDAKALKLTGGPTSPQPTPGRSLYAMMMSEKHADIFLAYCTAAQEAKKEVPSLQIVDIPEALAVGADYGLTIVTGARPEAARLAMYILSPSGQAILGNYGFSPVALPAPGS
jgi:ABC-type molybdate transport system substrate-binding protein